MGNKGYERNRRLGDKRAKELVENITYHEDMFRRKLDILGIRYEFQKVFYDDKMLMIVDFYLPKYFTVVEIDGDSHLSLHGKRRDMRKDSWLLDKGIKVWRIKNPDVEGWALDDIQRVLGIQGKKFFKIVL
jgi:very-short-patch-repair endonuclease